MIESARSGNTSTFDDLNQNWNRIAPISFLYERNTNRSEEISEELRQFYLKGKPVSLDNIDGLAQVRDIKINRKNILAVQIKFKILKLQL